MAGIVLVTGDKRRFDNNVWYGSPAQYADAVLEAAGALPLVLPAQGERLDLDAILGRVDGLLVTGSRSNVHPAAYGEAASPAHEPFDPPRDATTIPLIGKALKRGLPLLAICRGFQELNVALGGTLLAEIQDLPGRMDHRGPASDDLKRRYAIRHDVRVAPGSLLRRIVKAETIRVNSLHRQGIGRLAERLVVEGAAPDGTVEAVRVEDAPGFALAVQWHPEFWAASDPPSAALFRAFGEAVRAFAARRAHLPAAAE